MAQSEDGRDFLPQASSSRRQDARRRRGSAKKKSTKKKKKASRIEKATNGGDAALAVPGTARGKKRRKFKRGENGQKGPFSKIQESASRERRFPWQIEWGKPSRKRGQKKNQPPGIQGCREALFFRGARTGEAGGGGPAKGRLEEKVSKEKRGVVRSQHTGKWGEENACTRGAREGEGGSVPQGAAIGAT